ncbi:MAG: glycosyltransferase family 4 protein [Deltaproteobacteria bacterium]|nr:glycosyltransferase family 4 protein [Deltaproteobacteria bacterium]
MEKQRLWATLHPFFETGGIMGRSVANEGFIRAFLRLSPYTKHYFFLADEGLASHVRDRLERLFPDRYEAGAFEVTTRHALPEALASLDIEVFHLSDCVADTVPLLRLRNALSRSMFAITGTTHSLSYARYAANFFEQIWEGVTGRDAIIATSRAGEGAVAAMFSALREGYGLANVPSPRICRIPLGVAVEDFARPEEKSGEAAAVRRELGIAEDTLLLLVFARISHYSKMDILPLLRALLRAGERGLPKGRYTLVLAGWVDAGDAAAAYADLAARYGIDLRLVPSPDNAMRRRLFAGADMFLSPVDNPQETFGLTLLEAGAASLPVVASDFDGYRDLIVHGETGFLIPTFGPAATPETDALSGVWFDNQRHLQIAQQSVVSVPDMADAIGLLASDPALRARIGAAGRRRVCENFTWDRVVARHLALWDDLAATPVSAPPSAHPRHPGYTAIFGGYYSGLFDPEIAGKTYVRWTAFGEAAYRGKDFPAVYGGIERLVDPDAMRRMLFRARKPVLLSSLLPEDMTRPSAEREAFPVLWALKQDLLERVTAGA